ncbi:cupin domain-containing protein [Thermodesulfobacteriota bacterium]
MEVVFDLSKIQAIDSFAPPGHSKTADRKIIDRENGAERVAVWHSKIEPGGIVETHIHEEMEQVYYILDGEGLFKLGDREYRLGKGQLLFIPAKQPHEVIPTGEKALQILNIMAPPPASLDEWQKKP